jgi:hypothetical protein
MTRRTFLAASASTLQARERVNREVLLRSPAAGTAVLCDAYYTKASGGDMMSIEHRMSRSDTVDVSYYRYSKDNGRSWTAPVERRTGEKRPGGMLRRHPRACFVDPHTGRFLEFWVEGILPHDDPLEGMFEWNVFYRVDGGKPHQIIHQGSEFNPTHPLPDVWTGKNCVMLGDVGSVPIAVKDGTILVPAIVTPLGPDGKLYNPTGGYTYTDGLVLQGRWSGKQLVWEAGERIVGDPERMTRGVDEPTIGTLADGRLIVILRGSNDKKPSLPAYRWLSFSKDGGTHWTKPEPWTYDTGEPFFSPSACSNLVRHSSGKLFWLGHISATNPRGNRPRYPLWLAEVDQRSGRLIRGSLVKIDDRQPGEDEGMMIYSVYGREDRVTHEIVVNASRLFLPKGNFSGDAMLYRVTV